MKKKCFLPLLLLLVTDILIIGFAVRAKGYDASMAFAYISMANILVQIALCVWGILLAKNHKTFRNIFITHLFCSIVFGVLTETGFWSNK